MFKKFSSSENISSTSLAKTSVIRNIRKSIIQSYPSFENRLDQLIPKKSPVYLTKCSGHITLLVVGGIVLFFQNEDTQWLPSLRVLHQCMLLKLPKLKFEQYLFQFYWDILLFLTKFSFHLQIIFNHPCNYTCFPIKL